MLIGQLDIKVDPTVKAVFFALFLFATGYKVGPQFFRGLRKNALPQVALTFVLCVTSLVTTVVAARVMGYDKTGQPPASWPERSPNRRSLAQAQQHDRPAPILPEAEKTRLKNNIPVAYAVGYLVGTGFIVFPFLSAMAPRLLGVDLKAESRKLATQVSSADRTADEGVAHGLWGIEALPTYRLSDVSPGQHRGGVRERSASPERVFVERIRQTQRSSMPAPTPSCDRADVLAITARRRVFLAGGLPLGAEVENPALLDFPVATFDAVVTSRDVAEQPLSMRRPATRARGRIRESCSAAARRFPSTPTQSSTGAISSGSRARSVTWSVPGVQSAISSGRPVSRTSCSSAWALSSADSSGS